jgi:hypothetical protein
MKRLLALTGVVALASACTTALPTSMDDTRDLVSGAGNGDATMSRLRPLLPPTACMAASASIVPTEAGAEWTAVEVEFFDKDGKEVTTGCDYPAWEMISATTAGAGLAKLVVYPEPEKRGLYAGVFGPKGEYIVSVRTKTGVSTTAVVFVNVLEKSVIAR